MRHRIFSLTVSFCLLAAVSVPPAAGQETSGGAAEIERAGTLLGRLAAPAPDEAGPQPSVIRDHQGRLWAAWEKWDAGRIRVELTSFGSSGIESSRPVGTGEGFDLSPDLADPPAGPPWVIWINSRETDSRVLVLDSASGTAWRLSTEPPDSAAGPKIVFDAEGSAWAFWNTAAGQPGEIAYRVFRQGAWSEPAVVPRGTRWPAINPDAAAGDDGTVWLSWAGYDGGDYRIYLTHWTGSAWAPAVLVSRHPGPNLFPSLGFDADGSPLIAWTRTENGRRLTCLASFRDGTAGPETDLEAPPGPLTPPRLIQEFGGAALSLGTGEGLRVLSVADALAAGRPAAAVAAPVLPRLQPVLPLDENKYAGFGDSITFGYVDWYSHPERGYIPRLNAILNASYGSQRLINEGFGGEVTAEGLVRIDKVFIADLPQYLLIMEGTNDVIFTDITIPSAAFNLQEMVRKCLAAGAFPAIATIIPRFDWWGTQSLYQTRILTLNSRIRQIASDLAVPLIDMYAAFSSYPASGGGVLSLLSKDLKHPGDKGYQFMAETWFAGIRAFPFPPANASLVTLSPQRTSPDRVWARPEAAPRTPRTVPAEPRQPFGTLLTWAHSPKILDPAQIQGYRVYRRPLSDPTAAFELFVFVESPLEVREKGSSSLGFYDFALAAVRKDGIEGPLSEPAAR